MPEQDQKEYVENGMLSEYRRRIRLLRPRTLDDLQELIDVCCEEEEEREAWERENEKRAGPSRELRDLENRLMGAIEAMRLDNPRQSRSYQRDRFQETRPRPAPQNNTPRLSRTVDGKPICYVCGRAGHFGKVCPNNQRAARSDYRHARSPGRQTYPYGPGNGGWRR